MEILIRMTTQHYLDLLSRFDQARVLVVGDIYLDEYVTGVMTGISLEAPIPIYEVHRRKHNPGAAGNAACNVAALGAKTYMVGYVGQDANADIVRKEFAVRNVDTSGVVVHPDCPTNTYGKLRAGGFHIPLQEVLRTDTPAPKFVSGRVEEEIIENIRERAPNVDAIVVVDQVSSVATERVLREVIACAKKYELLTVGDSRKRAGALKGFDVAVPNDREAGIGVGIEVVDERSLRVAAKALLKVCKNLLITRGPGGITIFERNGKTTDVPVTVSPSQVVDVTGAGDTVTAAVAVTLIAGGSMHDAAVLGNTAAGVAVMQPGVVTVSKAELQAALLGQAGPTKVKTLEELERIAARLRDEGKTIVWTSGRFEALDVRCVDYLIKAAALGDVLMVGISREPAGAACLEDARPALSETERAFVLSALECVRYLTVLSDKTAARVLRTIKPEVYVKGEPGATEIIPEDERRVVEKYKGRIHIIPETAAQPGRKNPSRKTAK